MKLTEAEMRMVFQIESTNQNAALNEIYMTWRYAPNPATKETAEVPPSHHSNAALLVAC